MDDNPATSQTDAHPRLDYDEALSRASSLVDFERSTRTPGHSEFHLQRIGLLMQRLADPHLATPTVHVAGTNGKGSTAALVTSVLTAAGHTTGLYTSPSLHSPTERIRVGLSPISRETFAGLVSDAWPAVEWVGRFGGYGGVSYFELLTTMAFLHFRNIGAAFQVVEVGLGGRLDATNVVQPEVCAITSISLDHTRVLGDTVSLIAREKAGIVKPGAPVVIAPQTEDAMGVISDVAEARDAELISVEHRMSWRRTAIGHDGQSFELQGTGASTACRCRCSATTSSRTPPPPSPSSRPWSNRAATSPAPPWPRGSRTSSGRAGSRDSSAMVNLSWPTGPTIRTP